MIPSPRGCICRDFMSQHQHLMMIMIPAVACMWPSGWRNIRRALTGFGNAYLALAKIQGLSMQQICRLMPCLSSFMLILASAQKVLKYLSWQAWTRFIQHLLCAFCYKQQQNLISQTRFCRCEAAEANLKHPQTASFSKEAPSQPLVHLLLLMNALQ